MVARHDNHRPTEPRAPHTDSHSATLANVAMIGDTRVADEAAGTPSSREESGVSRSPSLWRREGVPSSGYGLIGALGGWLRRRCQAHGTWFSVGGFYAPHRLRQFEMSGPGLPGTHHAGSASRGVVGRPRGGVVVGHHGIPARHHGPHDVAGDVSVDKPLHKPQTTRHVRFRNENRHFVLLARWKD